MAESAHADLLNAAVDELLERSGRSPAAIDPELAPLVAVAGELLALPDEGFATRLAGELRTAASAGRPRRLPPGYGTLAACLVIRDPGAALEFYGRAFGASELNRTLGDDGTILHAAIRIGDSPIQLSPEAAEWSNLGAQTLGGTTVTLTLAVPDVDAFFVRALAAGARVERPVQDYFYGERAGTLTDPFGHRWIVGTHIEDVSDEEMQRRLDALYAGGA